jgi:response regulator RpfG family c-di-GMP phosphodiesterase
VIAEIDSLSGSQFDPALVAIFLDNLDGMRGVREAWRASA